MRVLFLSLLISGVFAPALPAAAAPPQPDEESATVPPPLRVEEDNPAKQVLGKQKGEKKPRRGASPQPTIPAVVPGSIGLALGLAMAAPLAAISVWLTALSLSPGSEEANLNGLAFYALATFAATVLEAGLFGSIGAAAGLGVGLVWNERSLTPLGGMIASAVVVPVVSAAVFSVGYGGASRGFDAGIGLMLAGMVGVSLMGPVALTVGALADLFQHPNNPSRKATPRRPMSAMLVDVE